MPDAVDVPSFFTTDPNAVGALTYPQLEARRRIAMALATRNRPYPKTIGEGLTALGEGIGEGYVNRGLESAEVAQQARDDKARGGLYAPVPPPAAPAAPGRTSDAAPEVPAPAVASDAPEAVTPASYTSEKPAGMSNEEWKARVARNESGGAKDPYSLIGPVSRRGDYPYGKFQVMGENVPKWTLAHYGKQLTPQEFLLNKDAQEAVADGQGGLYRAKYGDEGAAAAWFAGPNGMNDPNRKDTLGTHVAEYRRRFNLPLVSRDQVAASVARNQFSGAPMSDEAGMALAYAPEGAGAVEQSASPVKLASLGGGVPTPDTAPGRDAVAAAVARQQGVVPPQQVAAGPAPLPQPSPPPVPLAVQRTPVADPQPEDPGPAPKLDKFLNEPGMKAQMDYARGIIGNNTLTPLLRQQAAEKLKELHGVAQDEYTKQWTVWHEKDSAKRAFDLKAGERQRAIEEHDKAMQGQITAAAPSQPVDPRILGTPQSPQRTGIPSPSPKPAGVSADQWSKSQEADMAKAVAAVDSAEPDFKSMIRLIDRIRTHPGKEWGTGLTAGYAPRGTDAYAFSGGPEEGIVGQLKGKTFLSAYDKLRGGGSIANVEGSKAQQSVAAVNPAAGKEALDTALNELERQVRTDMETAQRKTNRPVTAWQRSNEDEVAPDKGQIVSGFKDGKTREYLGGDPRDISGSWRLVR